MKNKHYDLVLDFMKKFFKLENSYEIYFSEAINFLMSNESTYIQLSYALRSILRDRNSDTIARLINEGTNRNIHNKEDAIELLDWIAENILIHENIEAYENIQKKENFLEKMPSYEFVCKLNSTEIYDYKAYREDIVSQLKKLQENLGSLFFRIRIFYDNEAEENELWSDVNSIINGQYPCLYVRIQLTNLEQKKDLLKYIDLTKFTPVPYSVKYKSRYV